MKNFPQIIVFLFLFFLLPFSSNATIFKAVANTSWHLTSTWDQGNKLPGSVDVVVIDGFNVTFDNNAGDVTIKRLEINNSSNTSFLTIEGDNSFTVLNDLEVTANNIDKNVDLKIQGSVTFHVKGSSLFERVSGNNKDKRLRLHLLGSAIMTVDNDFTFNYHDSDNDEYNEEVLMEGSAKMNIGGHTYLNCHGGKEFLFELKGSSELTLIGNLEMNMTGGNNFFVASTSSLSHLQINGSATLTNSGGSGYFALGAGLNSGSLTVNGNVNLNSTATGKKVILASSGSSAIVEIRGNISMSAVSDEAAQIYLDDESVLKLGGALLRPTNYGALNMNNTSTLEFNGTISQTVPPTKLENTGNDSLWISNLSLKNTSTSPLILQGDLRVEDVLYLNSGKIITSETAMLYIEDNATIVGGSDAAYIEGPMVKIGRTDNQDFTFPIGNSTTYAPITISEVANSSSEIKAQFFGDPPPWGDNFDQSTMDNVNGDKYWSIGKNAGNDVKVTLHWSEAIVGGITDLDDMVVARADETVGLEEWKNYGNSATSGTTTEGSVTSSALLGDPPPWGDQKLTLGSISASNALPVELTKFQAAQQGTHVYLQWETASELNTSHFEIERSSDITNFETIGRKSSAGNTIEYQFYNTKDNRPENGLNYYRLKIVDTDGSFEYSHVEVVRFESEPTIELFPNPVKDMIQLKVDNLESQESTIEIFDKVGKRLFFDVLRFEDGQLELDVDKINLDESGTYFLRVTGKGVNHVLKFIRIN